MCVKFYLDMRQVACTGSDDGNKALREAKMLQAISHSNIVAYMDVFLNMDKGLLQVCTVMEFCKNGDLAMYLGKTKDAGKKIEQKVAANWMYQIADALCYLHSRQIVHRDLKPANVFLDEVSPSNMALKVGDFGLSASLEAGKRSSRVGTPCYLAPEVLMSEQYGESVDIWSAGCIFWEILTLDFLWQRRGCFGIVVQSEAITAEQLPSDVAYDLRQVVAACLKLNANSRPHSRDLSTTILNFQQGQTLDIKNLSNDQDWGKVVGNFFESALGSIFSADKQPQQHDHQRQSSQMHQSQLSAAAMSTHSTTSTSSALQVSVANAVATPEKRGLRWHSDMSLVDVKDITSHDFDQDFVAKAQHAQIAGR
jgi:serine/threonine protein kinase